MDRKKLVLIITTVIAGACAIVFTGYLIFQRYTPKPSVQIDDISDPMVYNEWMTVSDLSIALAEDANGWEENAVEDDTEDAVEETIEETEREEVEATEPELDTEYSLAEEEEDTAEENDERSGSLPDDIEIMDDASANGDLLIEAESGTDLTLASSLNAKLKSLPSKSYKIIADSDWHFILTKQAISSRFSMPAGMHAMVYPSKKSVYFDNLEASEDVFYQTIGIVVEMLSNNPQNTAEFKRIYDSEGSVLESSYGTGVDAFFVYVYDKLLTNSDFISEMCPEASKYVKKYQ